MSEAKKQVLIVSLYDRGFYLSNELAEQGHGVTLLNLPYKSNQPHFWSNPFGFFKNEKLTYNQKYYLDGPATHQAENGLSLWLEDGPIDFTSEFSEQVLASRGAKGDWYEPFTKSLFSTVNQLDKFVSQSGQGDDLFLDYSVKNSNVESVQHELKNSNRLGVKVITESISTIVKNKNKTSTVQIGGQVFSFDKTICLVSSYEANKLSEEILNYVYKGKSIAPEWLWLSASLEFEPSEVLNQVPEHFVVLKDVDTVWAYNNLLFVKKVAAKNQLEIKFRWPFNERENLKYINEELLDVKTFFENKIKNLKLKVLPVVSEELSPFYVYNQKELEQFNSNQKIDKNNIAFGPEHWQSWDLSSIMKRQYKLTRGESLNHD